MNLARRALLCAAAVTLTGAALAHAETPPSPTGPDGTCAIAQAADRFREFFEPAVGRWRVQITDRDASGAVEYQDIQIREFRFAIGGRFVRETAFPTELGRESIDVGMHLYAVDPTTGQVMTHGFWGNAADRYFLVVGCFTGSVPSIEGVMTVREPNGRERRTRSFLTWERPDHLAWRTFGEVDGREFLDEELLYSPVQ